MGQVGRGWLTRPNAFRNEGEPVEFKEAHVSTAFRFGFDYLDKPRECDDFKYGQVNLRRTALYPNKLPNWDHISPMRRLYADTDFPMAFFKAGRDAVYKNPT